MSGIKKTVFSCFAMMLVASFLQAHDGEDHRVTLIKDVQGDIKAGDVKFEFELFDTLKKNPWKRVTLKLSIQKKYIFLFLIRLLKNSAMSIRYEVYDRTT